MNIIDNLIKNANLNVIKTEKPNYHRLSPNLNIMLGLSEKCSVNNEEYYCVIWYPNFISSNNIGDSVSEGISPNFSGCLMARYIFHHYYFIDHIHIADGNSKFEEWKQYAMQYNDIILFRPAIKFAEYYLSKIIKNKDDCYLELFGIIDTEGNCYSVFLGHYLNTYNYKLYGILKHTDKTRFTRTEIANLSLDTLRNPITEVIYERW